MFLSIFNDGLFIIFNRDKIVYGSVFFINGISGLIMYTLREILFHPYVQGSKGFDFLFNTFIIIFSAFLVRF